MGGFPSRFRSALLVVAATATGSRRSADRLADGLAEIVLGIGASLRQAATTSSMQGMSRSDLITL